MRELIGLLLLISVLIEADSQISRQPDAFIEQPRLECQSSGLRLHLKPLGNFTGHVYVRGFFNDNRCHLDYSTRPMSTPFFVDVPYLGECAVQKQRMADPAGILFSVVVIAQKHRMLVTHGDRAFRLNCFYRQAETHLEHSLDVSDLPPSPLAPPAPVLPPSCSYDVLSASLNGPKIRTATVGEPIVHKWSCDSNSTGFLVHSCVVRDPAGEEYQLVDERGCITDHSLLSSPLTYADDLSVVFTTIPAFRFAEQLLVLFTCQITVCHKAEDGCEGIAPPQCEQLSVDLPIKTEYKNQRPEEGHRRDLLPVREEVAGSTLGSMQSSGETDESRDQGSRHEASEDQRSSSETDETERAKLKKKLLGTWTDEEDDTHLVSIHGDSPTALTGPGTISTSPAPLAPVPGLERSGTGSGTSTGSGTGTGPNSSDQQSGLPDKYPTTYETADRSHNSDDLHQVESGQRDQTTTSTTTTSSTTEQPVEEQTYATLTVFPSSSGNSDQKTTTESTRVETSSDFSADEQTYSTTPYPSPSPSSSSTTSTSTSTSTSVTSTATQTDSSEFSDATWTDASTDSTTQRPRGSTSQASSTTQYPSTTSQSSSDFESITEPSTSTEQPLSVEEVTELIGADLERAKIASKESDTAEKASQTDETFAVFEEETKILGTSTETPQASGSSSENVASLYESSPQEPYSANAEFSSSHVAETMKAGPNTGNYDTSMGQQTPLNSSEIEIKKAQLVARSNQRGPDAAIHTPTHRVMDNAPFERVEADRRPVLDASPQFSLDAPSSSSSRDSLTPIVPIVTSPLNRFPVDHPARNSQWNPPTWEAFPAPRRASIFRVGGRMKRAMVEGGRGDGSRRMKRQHGFTLDVHADEILVLTTEEVALQRTGQPEARNLRQVSRETRQQDGDSAVPRAHNLTLQSRLLLQPEDGDSCSSKLIVPILAVIIIAIMVQVITCSALFSQRKRHSTQLKQLMNVHYSS